MIRNKLSEKNSLLVTLKITSCMTPQLQYDATVTTLPHTTVVFHVEPLNFIGNITFHKITKIPLCKIYRRHIFSLSHFFYILMF